MNFIGAVRGRYGNILYWNRDIVIASGIAAYGEYFESEVDIFRMYVSRGDAVIDCGANVGAHTLALASIVGPNGAVMAIEPQRPIFQVMCANAIINDYLNVYPIHAAVGREPSFKTFIEPDYTKPNSYGGYETTRRAETIVGARTRVECLDALSYEVFENRQVSFIKIDVEGSEADAINGAEIMLGRNRPVLYVENDRHDRSADLIRTLRQHGYTPYWHIARFYNPKNLAGRPDDIPMNKYGWVGGKINGAALMLLCIPKEKKLPLPSDVKKVVSDDEWPGDDECLMPSTLSMAL